MYIVAVYVMRTACRIRYWNNTRPLTDQSFNKFLGSLDYLQTIR